MKCKMCGGGMPCYEHGGRVRPSSSEGQKGWVHDKDYTKGVHRETGGGESYAGTTARKGATEASKDMHKMKLEESRSMPNPKLKGLAEGGVAGEDGEPMDDMAGVDDELMDMACQELIDALHSKNKKEVLESLKAIILSCKE